MHKFFRLFILPTGISLFFATQILAQAVSMPFGNLSHDTTLPVEIVSDSFTVSQNRGTAEFLGNVVVGQGTMRLSAEKVLVKYSEKDGQPDNSEIDSMTASGGVTLVSGDEAAEADTAVYSIEKGTIVMEGNVLLTQGSSAIAGQKMVVNLDDGSARMEGRVKTIFKTGGSE